MIFHPPAFLTSAPPSQWQVGEESYPLTLTRHPQAKRISLRFDPVKRHIRLTLPKRTALAKGLAFISQHQQWLEGQVAKYPAPVALNMPENITLLGETLALIHTEGTRGRCERHGNTLHITCPANALPRRIEDYGRKLLKPYIASTAQTMAAQLGAEFSGITIRHTTSRWGSCSSKGHLNFCWKLVFAPLWVLDYVIAHEVAHLKEMNHSPAFWQQVARIYPDYAKARAWLNTHGGKLHLHGDYPG